MPKIDIAAPSPRQHCGYPAPFHEIGQGPLPQAARRRRRAHAIRRQPLPAGAGLRLLAAPLARKGGRVRLRARRRVVLVEDEGETVLRPGDAAAFKAGVANGHHLVNRSGRDALMLEIGTPRPRTRAAHYSDIDMDVRDDGGPTAYLHKDGTPYRRRAAARRRWLTRISASRPATTASRSSPGTCRAAR